MVLHDEFLNDGSCQLKIFNRASALLQKLPFRSLNRMPKENLDRSYNSKKMIYFYSKRFPDMCMSSSFYDDIMNIAEMHVNYYRSRWFDFSQVNVESSCKEPTVPWVNRSVLQSVNIPNIFTHNINNNNNQKEFSNNNNQKDFSNNNKQKDFSNNNNKQKGFSNNNNNQKGFSKDHTPKVQSPIKLNNFPIPTSNSVDSLSESISPIDFNEVVTPVKVKSKKKCLKKLPEENNNTIHDIDDDDIKNESISSDSIKSDITDEKTVSYAEIIKHSKPSSSKKNLKSEINITEEFKKLESFKCNRIPPSKKISIKLPDAPFLPNNHHCAFCKNNGEEESVYRTHFVKDEIGNVKCPFLSRYTCPNCKATGTKAHTISRCPLNNKNKVNKFIK